VSLSGCMADWGSLMDLLFQLSKSQALESLFKTRLSPCPGRLLSCQSMGRRLCTLKLPRGRQVDIQERHSATEWEEIPGSILKKGREELQLLFSCFLKK
jgi:hypothetical protein